MNQAFTFPDAKPPRQNHEEMLQRAIVQHLKLRAHPDVIWFHCPSGEHRSKRTAGRLKAVGVVPGVSDLVFLTPDGPYMMELKVPGGRLSPAQKAFQSRCDKIGVPYVVCWSIDSALSVLKSWGVIR